MWKCTYCGSENSDTAVRCHCGYDESRNYRNHFVITRLTEKDMRLWSQSQPGNKYMKDWITWTDSLKKEFQSFDNVEAEWFFEEIQKRCDGLVLQAKNIKKEAQRLNEEGYRWYHAVNREQDYDKAVSYYKKAAKLSNQEAINNLGICYLKGHGVLKNERTAVEYFSKSADAGNAIGQYYMGYCCQNGKGLKKDTASAFQWYLQSANNGYAAAQRRMGDYYFGMGYMNLSADAEKSHMKDAVYWYEKAAEGGDVEAQRNLGYCYRTGKGVKMHKAKAAGWYEKAALQGDVISQKIMAELYQVGEGVKKDESQAEKWSRRAANNPG